MKYHIKFILYKSLFKIPFILRHHYNYNYNHNYNYYYLFIF